MVSGLALTVVSAFGALLPAALLLTIARGRGAVERSAAALAVLVPVWYVAVILVMPTPANRDYTEYGHRSFVFGYAALAALAGAAIGRRLLASVGDSTRARLVLAVCVLPIVLVLGALVPWRQAGDIQQRWGAQFSTVPMAPDAIAAASYIRAHSSPGEYVLSSDEDPLAIFVGLTERPAFVSRRELFRLLGGSAAALAGKRAYEHAALPGIADFEQLRTAAQQLGIAWYIVAGPDDPHGPTTARSRCGYCGSAVRVYHLR